DPEWDGLTPPHFRIRVLDVHSERNERTAQLLDDVNATIGTLGGLIPHPIIPGFAVAAEAAKLIFANTANTVLLDYRIQFYSQEQRAGAGQAELSPLRRGEWLAVGRPANADSLFWNTLLRLDRKTGMILGQDPGADGSATPANPWRQVMAPYVAITIF